MAQPSTIKSGLHIEDVAPKAPRKYSTFPELSHRFLQTHRFGEITPHCVFATMKGAKDSFRCMNDTSTYTLKAPLKTDMFQKRSNFFVPLQAILYNNWELVVAQPNQGDDVLDDVNGVVTGQTIFSFIKSCLDNFRLTSVAIQTQSEPAGTSQGYFSNYLTILLRNLLALEAFCSQGSLLKQLGYDFSHLIYFDRLKSDSSFESTSFDVFSEHVLSAIAPRDLSIDGIHSFTVTWYDEDENVDTEYAVFPDVYLSDNIKGLSTQAAQRISYRHFLELARQNLNFVITEVDCNFVDPVDWEENNDGTWQVYLSTQAAEYLFGDWYNLHTVNVGLCSVDAFPSKVNFNRVSAYQILCAHFFSIDHVDYIYSAQLYRQLMSFFIDNSSGPFNFYWNGLTLKYDALSGRYIKACLDNFSYFGSTFNAFSDSISLFIYESAYFVNLFSFRHSLRNLDYFTGGRTRPLSVGDVGVAVAGGEVNAVDMILKQNAARYLNFAQRVGRKISNWLDQLMPGGQPRPDMHDPQWLSSTGDALIPEQVQNTGAAQVSQANSITSNLKSNSNRYQFTLTADRPGYVLCVTYYDIPRAYAYATDRENFHADRYDMFNPFFQYNGSQAVTQSEIGLGINGDTPFAYQGKYSEYKQKADLVAGGFVEFLPGWAFIADTQAGLPMQTNLNPTYIRSWNVELDPFYTSLTGYGLAAYFHFIVKNVNVIKGVRPMEYCPQLM